MKGNTKVAKICKIDFVELFKRAPLYLGGGKRKDFCGKCKRLETS